MIRCTERDGAVVFEVRVVPNASRNGITGEHDGALRVRIATPPVEGAANEALRRYLARAFKVAGRNVEIISGRNSKNKSVRVYGSSREVLESLSKGE